MRFALAWLTAITLTGCVGAPSPLAPGLHGAVGVPHLGVQTEGVEFPQRGAGFVRYRPYGTHYWALPRLIRAVEGAAAHVAATLPGGEPLVVGDFSARHGGKILGHNSHRTGRDVDLLYYVSTPAGAPRQSPGFIAFQADGLAIEATSGDFYRLDVAREWELIKYLLTTREVGVQFMFAAHDVEALIIDYALARGEPPELIHRAQTVLLQPTDSQPHDDHLHLRIACAPEEVVCGCSGGGPYWEWLPELPAPLALDPSELSAIGAEDPLDSDSLAATPAPPATKPDGA